MALKSIMIAKKLELKRAAFEALVAKDAEFATRSAEIEKSVAGKYLVSAFLFGNVYGGRTGTSGWPAAGAGGESTEISDLPHRNQGP